MSGWYLGQISIEGFRGINNENSPLILKLQPDRVNSISAPNGVGKSSIFEAVSYALTGAIPKLESLLTGEQGQNYYLNLFHSGSIGTIELTLLPVSGGAAVTLTVVRDSIGNRIISTSYGSNGEAIIAELNREFVLLDSKSFQHFIELKPLDRGRSFAGLLGLERYSELRQGLLGLSNTRAFNNHFGVAARKAAKSAAESSGQQAHKNIQQAYTILASEDFDPSWPEAELLRVRTH